MFTIEKYSPENSREWDDFVKSSRNGTFLLERGYMDYHSDRFQDCSWMVRKGNSLVALLPANITADGVLHSHQGLTYGGWILPPAHLDGADLLEIFQTAMDCWRAEGIVSLDYKPIPTVYHRQPSQEDEYALWRLGAVITESTLDTAVDLRIGYHFNTLRRRNLTKASKLPLQLVESHDVVNYISMLSECLSERHNASPVHSADELRLLMERFPNNIRIFVAKLADSDSPMDAGVCVYDTGLVAHAQYIATTSRGRSENLLTPLFNYLMGNQYADRNYFDFGISTEDGGRYLNEGLLRQKYSFGATGVASRRYLLTL